MDSVITCRGGSCDKPAHCDKSGCCLYKSSADEFREVVAAERIALTEIVRKFDTGATRSPEGDKYDYEAFLSPLVLERYAEYMHKHRFQADGTVRDGDNWQKGIPLTSYAKSAWRHFMTFWKGHRELIPFSEEDACALLFNIHGYLHEKLKARGYGVGR